MAAKKQQTHAKRARELAVKERRERKRARKAEAAAQRAAGNTHAVDGGNFALGAKDQAGSAAAEWVR
jgi:hypothetical protein